VANDKNYLSAQEPWDLPGDSGPAAPIVRGNFREPIADGDGVLARIANQDYQVLDICHNGIGLAVGSLDSFADGARCELTLRVREQSMKISALVAHISPGIKWNECHCGLEFVTIKPQDAEYLQRFIAEHHARLFRENSPSS